MDYLCSLTGKSPSTTGAGSEGALTKGPFNALMPSTDLNNIIVSMILTELGGFSTAAGHVGPRFEVGHDISLLVPEIWCRMTPEERDPNAMIADGMLEKIEDFEHNGVHVPASRLGLSDHTPLRPNVHGDVSSTIPSGSLPKTFCSPKNRTSNHSPMAMLHIAEAQKRVAKRYLEDGGYDLACPPSASDHQYPCHR